MRKTAPHKPPCPHCGKPAEWYKATKSDTGRVYCRNCAKYYNHPVAPKVLIFDIETSRMKVNAFQTGKQVIRGSQIDQDWFVICWSAKWLFSKEIFGSVVTPQEAKKRNDKRVITELSKEIQKADFLITFNGNGFDIPKVLWRYIYHKIPPPPPVKSIDVMKRLTAVARPSSHGMDFLAKQLGYVGKLHTSEDLWEGCEAGKQDSLDYMLEYNKVDVWKTEDLYTHFRPYMKDHPNLGAFLEMYQDVYPELELSDEECRCPRCLTGIIHRSKFTYKYQTPAGMFYSVARCPHCGAMVRKTRRKNKQNIEVR